MGEFPNLRGPPYTSANNEYDTVSKILKVEALTFNKGEFVFENSNKEDQLREFFKHNGPIYWRGFYNNLSINIEQYYNELAFTCRMQINNPSELLFQMMEENNRRFDEKVDAKKSKLMPDEEDDMIIRTERDLKSIIEQAILIGSEPSSRMIKSQVNAPLDVPESETHQEFISRVGKNHEKRKRAEKEEYQRNYELDVKHGKYFNKWATDKYRSFFNEDTLNKKDISEISKTIGKIEITDKTNAFDVRSEDKETTLSGNTLSVKKDGLKKSMQPKSKDFHQSHHNYYNGYNYRSQHYANNLHNEYSNANIRNKVENPIYYPPRVEVKTKDRRNKFDYQQNVPNYIYHSNNYFDRRKPEYSELVWACVYIPQFYAVFNPRIPPPNHVSDLLVQNYVIYHN